MMKLQNTFYIVLLSMLAIVMSGCKDDLFSKSGDYDGPVAITLDISFNPLEEGLTMRGAPSNLDFDINDLTVFFYAEEEGTPAKCYQFKKGEYQTELEKGESETEPRTRHAQVTITDTDDTFKGKAYRIYAVANIEGTDLAEKDLETISEKQLRETKISWGESSSSESMEDEIAKDPKSYNIPNAMFGYFHRDESFDHKTEHNKEGKDKRDVIYHKGGMRPEAITFDQQHIALHAWLKRAVSRLTVGFDGSQLNEGVEIYIQSVSIKDAVKECYLGQDYQANYNDDLLENDGTDSRLNIVYTGNIGITCDQPAFPRKEDGIPTKAADGWNRDWYEYVHGNKATLDPNGESANAPIALYFMENMQGIGEDVDGVAPKGYKENYDPEGDYVKDGKPYGTYVEVKARYKNSSTSGNIVYRFMLGQNTTNDFNTERNHHYKLTLSFIGDANDIDWHIDFEEEEVYWFPIPNESQWDQSWVWHAYNEDGEPVAEICKEMVFYHSDGDPNETSAKRAGSKYYQVVTVYPVKRNNARDDNDKYKYTVDLNNGRIAQVLACATKELDNNDLQAGGEISMLLRTQADPIKHESPSERPQSKYGDRAIRNITTGNHANYNFVQILSSTYDQKIPGPILMSVNNTNYNNGSYIKFRMSDDETDKNKFEYKLDLVEEKQGKEFRIRPYRIQDADGNSYSITKIGGSYWTRENLRSKHYFAVDDSGKPSGKGKEIFPYKFPKYEQIYIDENGNEIKTNFDSENGYDYDYGIENEGSGWVHFYERYPMYKECDGGNFLMYNFFAAIGVQGKIVDGSLSYKKGNSINPAHRILNNTENNLAIVTQIGSINQKKYENPDNEIKDIDTTEPYDLEPFDPTNYNLPLAPEGWHTLPLDDSQSQGPGPFGEMKNEYQYFYCYFADYSFDADNWEYALSEIGYTTGYRGWKWPKSYTKITKKNLTGLSILPIPADWEDNKEFVTFDASDGMMTGDAGLYQGTLHGVVIPCWWATLYDYPSKTGSTRRNNPSVYDLYPDPPFMCAPDSGFFSIPFPVMICFSEEMKYWKLTAKSYLPIRMVRNAYDYSVEKIEPVTN